MQNIRMTSTPSKLSRQELDEYCTQFRQLLQGPMRQHLLAIDAATEYFANIPKDKLTPEMAALDEIFSEESHNALRESLLDDIEVMEGSFERPEQQDEFWFGSQHVLYVQATRLALYYPLVQKAAQQYGFMLPNADEAEPMTGREYYQRYVLGAKK